MVCLGQRALMPETLLIDWGNSCLKWRYADGVTHVSATVDDLAAQWRQASEAWLSVVDTSRAQQLRALLPANAHLHLARSQSHCAGLRNGYAQASSLGVDRWLALLGARALAPESAFVLLSAGSAVTLDFVSADGQHQGGYIVAGKSMQRSALAKIPALRAEDEDQPLAKLYPDNTAAALTHGYARMLQAFISTEYQSFVRQHQQADLFISGGDGDWLAAQLDLPLRHQPHLVLDGLQLYAQGSDN